MTTVKVKKIPYVPQEPVTVGYSSCSRKPSLEQIDEYQSEEHTSKWAWRNRVISK
jgi:hypothetical protein